MSPTGIPIDIEAMFQTMDMRYRKGYSDGYEQAKRDMLQLVDILKKHLENMEAFHETTATVAQSDES